VSRKTSACFLGINVGGFDQFESILAVLRAVCTKLNSQLLQVYPMACPLQSGSSETLRGEPPSK
jgi:hypothetical protein